MNKIRKIFTTTLIFLTLILIKDKCLANEIKTPYYNQDLEQNIIYRIEPDTTIENFKSKINIDSVEIDDKEAYNELHIYKEKECKTEVTEGNIGTGMYLNYGNELYQLSVIGDFDGDGKATQVELTNIIRYIVGLQGAELEGVKYKSGDLTGDEVVDQRDITKYIRYIVYGELDLGKVDKTPPEVVLHQIKQTTNELIIGAKAIDRESGMGENPIFTFYVKKSDESENSYKEVQKEAKSTVDLEELEQDTWYDIKVAVQDKAGNETIKSTSAITGKIPNGTEEGAIIFGDINWENGMASITISTEKDKEATLEDRVVTEGKFSIEYQVNGTNGVWKKGEYVTGLKHNDIVYARLTDGTNSGTFIFKTIKDEIEPEVTMNIITNEAELSATATVVGAKDNESGMESNPEYTFYIKEENEPDENYKQIQKGKNKTCDIKNLEANKTYIVKAEVQDKAGNIGKAEEKIRIEQKEEQIPDGTEAGAIIFGTPKWSSGQAEVTISTTTKYQIEYQVNGISGTWTKGTAVTGLKHNDVIYARLTNGTKVGNYTTLTVIDAIPPQLNISTVGDTSKITVTVNAVDNETGIDGSSNYVFYIRKSSEPESSYVEVQRTTSTTCEITGLQSNETYIIKVEIEDKAGNKGTKETSETTSQIPDATQAGSIIFSNVVWNMGQAEVTITTSTKYQIEYQVNGINGAWTRGTTVTGLNHNDIIYARLTDGTNVGNYTTLTVVDAVKPNIQLDLQAQNQEITAKTTATDDESGIDANVKYTFYIKETGQPDSSYVEKQNTTSATCSFPGLTVGNNYTVKVEVEDKAGNKGMIEKSILIPDDIAPVVSLSVINKTSNTATVQASATDVGGLPTPTIYVFYIKETGADDSTYVKIQDSNNSQCTFTGLVQNKDYTVKVTVADEAGNVGVKETSILTDQIPDATQAGAITFNSIVWNNGKATVTIGTNTSYQIEYQVNGTSGTWIKGTTVTGLNHKDMIYARLTDGKNVSNYATVTVVDSVKPQIALSLTSDTSKITAIANAVDNETGLGTNPIYTFYIKKSNQPDSSYIEKQKTTSNTCDITGLEQSKNYTIKVEVTDIAGNIGNKQETVSTKTIPNATQAGAIKFGAIIWNSGKAEVAISTNTTLQIEYQVNGTTGAWIKGTTVTGLNHNDVIYARLTDGTNAGKYATLTIADATPPEAFTVSVTDIKSTGLKISGSTIDNQTGIASYTYVALASTGNKIEYPNITATSYDITGVEPETEYTVYMLAYDNAGNVRKSNEVKVTTKKLEIQITTPIVNTNTNATSSLGANTQTRGTTLYINFKATVEEINCTIEPAVPYAVTSNGKYKFIVTGTYQNKTITKEIEVIVNQYQAAQRLVQYDAGDWTEEEINNMKNSKLYDLNVGHTKNNIFKLDSEYGLNFTFGGFTYKGDTANQWKIDSGNVITSRNKSVRPENGQGIPKYDGWQVLESKEENGKTYVTKLVHAGTPENFVYYYTTSKDSYRAEYLLSNGERQTGYKTLKNGTTINPRNWDMYKDKELDKKGYIKEVHAMTYSEALAITGSKGTNNSIRNTESFYWLGDTPGGGTFLWFVGSTGQVGSYSNHCSGIRPVVTLESGVYIESGDGTGASPYILGKE